MYCVKCGTKNVDDAAFCINCGEKVPVIEPKQQEVLLKQETSDSTQAGIPDPTEPSAFTSQTPNKGASFGKVIGLSFGGLLALIAGIIPLVLSVQKNKFDSPEFISGIALVIVGLALCVWGVVLTYIYIYRAWLYIQDGYSRTTPGKAVGFLFIPFFNIYWIFQAYWGWAQDYNKYIKRYNLNIPEVPEGLFLAIAILNAVMAIPYIGALASLPYLIISIIVFSKTCKTINSLAIIHNLGVQSQSLPASIPQVQAKDNTGVIIGIIVAGFVFVAMLGIMAAVAIPKFADLTRKSKEGTTKGGLGSMKSALSIYYGTMEGACYPETIEAMTTQFLESIPAVKLGKSWDGENKTTWKPDPTPDTPITLEDVDNSTAWMYNNTNGYLAVNNNGTDTKGEYYFNW